MKTLQQIGEAQLQAYEGQKQIADALAAGMRHPIARIVSWANRIMSRTPLVDGPSYRDYPYSK